MVFRVCGSRCQNSRGGGQNRGEALDECEGRVIFIQVLFFESYLEIKEDIISAGSTFGRIRVGLRMKDRNPTRQSYPES